MSISIRKLILNTLQLGLILSLYLTALGVVFRGPWKTLVHRFDPMAHELSAVSESAWGALLHSQHRINILLALLIPSLTYIAAFRFGRDLHEKRKLHALLLCTVATTGFVLIPYSVFFAHEKAAQIIALTLAFLVAIVFMAFCESGKTKAWKNLYRTLQVALLIAAPVAFWLYPGALLQPLSPLFSQFQHTLQEGRYKAETSTLHTAFYSVALTEYYMQSYRISEEFPEPRHISALDDKTFLVIDRRGNVSLLSLEENTDNNSGEERLHVKNLAAQFPINHREFFASEAGKRADKNSFKVHDLFTDTENGRRRLYVSHSFWDTERRCSTLRITKLVGEVSALLENDAAPEWHTLYETAPCLPLNKADRAFAGHRAGGKIVGLDENTLLFSVGDHGLDKLNASREILGDIDVAYGKIWKIDRDTGASELFSVGHRNPRGLYHASDGVIWETERESQDSDELNRVEPGKNDGEPRVVTEAPYGRVTRPPGVNQDAPKNHDPLVFAWTPPVGVSNLIRIEGDLFPLWKHSLLVGALKTDKLLRLQMHGNRVIYSEPIHIGQRVRDITETPNGEIFIWAEDRRALFRLRPTDARTIKGETVDEAGKRLFQHKCAGCHRIRPNAPHGIGPNLHGAYAGPIAGAGDFNYSPALQAMAHRRWTRENLDLFMEDPDAFAPGTSMQMKIPDDYERRALLLYLEKN